MNAKPKIETVLPILQGLLATGTYVQRAQMPETKNEMAVTAIQDAAMIAVMLGGVLNLPQD